MENKKTSNDLMKVLIDKKKLIRYYIGMELKLKYIPKLRFYHDDTMEHAENIDNFLEKTDREINLLVYCYVGNSSKGASEYFVQNGFKTVFSLDGGYEEYAREK